jgi:hypothetical protein
MSILPESRNDEVSEPSRERCSFVNRGMLEKFSLPLNASVQMVNCSCADSVIVNYTDFFSEQRTYTEGTISGYHGGQC